MKFQSKMALVVAVVAVIAAVGGAAGVAGVERLWNNWMAIGGGALAAFAVFVGIKLLQKLKQIVCELQWIAEKCRYIEKRIDHAAARSGDVCRHLQQVFLEFDVSLNEGQTVEMKWWWVDRRLRQLYEDFSNCKAMEKCSYEVVKKTWSMLQLEVKMRTLRDVVSYRHFEAELLEDDEDMEWALKNMNSALQYCSFWHPMQINALENHVVQSSFEELLISQITERVKELKQYLQGADMKKYEGLQLEGLVASSSK